MIEALYQLMPLAPTVAFLTLWLIARFGGKRIVHAVTHVAPARKPRRTASYRASERAKVAIKEMAATKSVIRHEERQRWSETFSQLSGGIDWRAFTPEGHVRADVDGRAYSVEHGDHVTVLSADGRVIHQWTRA